MSDPIRIGDAMARDPEWRTILRQVRRVPKPQPLVDGAGCVSGLNPWDVLRSYRAGVQVADIAASLNATPEQVAKALVYALRRRVRG